VYSIPLSEPRDDVDTSESAVAFAASFEPRKRVYPPIFEHSKMQVGTRAHTGIARFKYEPLSREVHSF